jgi:PPOX class probable F420-dependent enzyme
VNGEEARELLASARVARLASTDAEGRPHLVPITFAVEGDTILTAVDHKPKRTTRLRRLANIAADPRVSVLADHYEEEWSNLWWARADGLARVLEPGTEEHVNAVAQLAARYPQYAERRPDGPAIEISVSRWSGWRARLSP